MGDLSENPLSNMNPISQYNELKDNINQLKENVTKIVKIIKPLIGEGLAAPCDMSKKLSNIMCSVSDNLNNGLDKLSDMDDINIESLIPSLNMNIFEAPLNIAKKIATESLKNTKKMTNTIDALSVKLQQDTKNKGVINKKGGSNTYMYIVNPVTNRKVKTTSKLGKKIIKQYFFHL